MRENDDTPLIKDRLVEMTEAVAERCIGKMTRHGRELQCRAGDSPTGSKIAVVVGGPKRGLVMIYDGANEKGTSLLNLIYRTRGGGDWPETYRLAREWTGLPTNGKPLDPIQKARMAREAAERLAKRDREAAVDRKRRIETVEGIWKQTQHIKGTLGQQYFGNRGISPHHIEMAELRFHPRLEHPEGKAWPAVVARVKDVDGNGIAIWRIYLDPATGLKAPVSEAKLGLGPAAGGAVRLGDDGRADEIAVVEGLETGEAVRELLMWQMPVWCGLATSGMAGLVVPDRIMFVHIYPDGDKPKSYRKINGVMVPLAPGETIEPPGRVAARTLAERLQKIGRGWNIEPEPDLGSDYLDVLISSKKADAE